MFHFAMYMTPYMADRKKQHYNPCGHLDRFAKNRKIFVTKKGDLNEFVDSIDDIALHKCLTVRKSSPYL